MKGRPRSSITDCPKTPRLLNTLIMFNALLQTPSRFVPSAILVAGVGALSAAYAAEYIFGLEPCILCLYQRIPYAVAVILAVAALSLRSNTLRAAAMTLCAAAFLVGASIAFYQVGVEQHWWKAATGCGGALPSNITLEQMNLQITSKPQKPCDLVDWTLFGISMATYNVAVSLLLAAAALAGAKRIRNAT